MTSTWATAKLGDVLRTTTREDPVDRSATYRLLGVRLDGEGPFLREEKSGSAISSASLARVRAGDFIYSRLFAWRGAFGVIPQELGGCHVSGEFPTFEAVPGRVDLKFLGWWFRLPDTLRAVEAECSGSTPLTRNRLKEERFLALRIPLPSLAEQQRIVARIEALAARIAEARSLRSHAAEAAEALVSAQISTLWQQEEIWKSVRDVVSQQKNAVRSGPFGSQLLHEEFTVAGVTAIGTRDVQTNKFMLRSGWFINPEKFAQFSRYQVFPGDVLCTIVGASIGRFCVVPPDVPLAFTTKHIQALTLDVRRANPAFVAWMITFAIAASSPYSHKWKDQLSRALMPRRFSEPHYHCLRSSSSGGLSSTWISYKPGSIR